MLYLYVDEDYRMSYSWLARYQIIKRTARKKRSDILEIRSLEEIPESDSSAMLLIRSASRHFLTEVIIQANQRGIYPVVIANLPPFSGLRCSSIGSDMQDETLSAIEFLSFLGCRNLAFFGVNPSPYSDQFRAQIFERALGSREYIYQMEPSYSDAFQKFISHAKEHDGIIVSNVATAVALINGLKEHGYTKDMLPRIVAFGHLGLLKYYTPSISTISDDISNLGELVFNLYDMIQKSGNGMRIHISLNKVISSRETTGFVEPPQLHPYARYSQPFQKNSYFDSPEITEVMRVERLLQQADETDVSIIYSILQNNTYEKIAESNKLSLNAVNYRIKRIKETLALKNLNEIKKCLNKYFYE